MKNVSVKNEYIKKLSSIELAIMLVLNKSAREDDHIMINSKFIQYELFGEVLEKQKEYSKYDNAILSLIEKGIIKVIYRYGTGRSTDYVISNENIFIDEQAKKDKYTYLSFDYVRMVAKSNIDCLKVLLAIVSSFNNGTRVGYDSIDNYCSSYDIAKMTFLRHSKLLEKMNVLYIRRNATINIDGEIKNINNDYGFTDNINMVNIVADEYENKVLGANGKEKKHTNNKLNTRSISANYNNFIKGKFKGDVDKLKEDCIAYNDLQVRTVSEEYRKLKDLSVFDAGVGESTIVSDNWGKECPDFTDNIGFVTMQNSSNGDSEIFDNLNLDLV